MGTTLTPAGVIFLRTSHCQVSFRHSISLTSGEDYRRVNNWADPSVRQLANEVVSVGGCSRASTGGEDINIFHLVRQQQRGKEKGQRSRTAGKTQETTTLLKNVFGNPVNGRFSEPEMGTVLYRADGAASSEHTHNGTSKPVWLNNRLKLTVLDYGRRIPRAYARGPAEVFRSLCDDGQLDKALNILLHMEPVPSVNMYRSLLKACTKRKAVLIAKRVHAHLAERGLESTRLLGEEVVNTLAKCGSLEDALEVFHRLQHRNVFCWTAVISAYVNAGLGREALRMYEQMQAEAVQPNRFTFVSLIRACSGTANLMDGKHVHAEVLKHSCESDVFVGACLVRMYWKCGSIADAQSVFNGLSNRNVVSWTAMLSAYTEQGEGDKVLQLYEQMQDEGVSPDAQVFVYVLQACGMLAEKEEVDHGQWFRVRSLEKGKAVHCYAQRKDCVANVFVSSTLISMYGKCRSIADAWNVFINMDERDIVSWNAMLETYVSHGLGNKTLQLYEEMLQEGWSPDERTFVSVIQACSILAEMEVGVLLDGQAVKVKCLETGKAFHADAQRKGYASQSFLVTALITMYGKCGDIVNARNVFEMLPQRNVVVWTAMLAAYVEQDKAEEALHLFRQMQQQSVIVNEVTVVCTLQACSKTGSLGLVRQIHQSLVCSGHDVSPSIASCLIAAYGRCASMVDAQDVFDVMPQPDCVSWNALIAAYARQGDYVASLQIYEKMGLARIRPNNATFLSLLIACSHAGLVDKGLEYFECMGMAYGLQPQIEHYASLVDLFARAGCFTKLEHLLSTMPIQPDLAIWLCVLGACQKHSKVELGERAFKCAVQLEPAHPAAYGLMSNIYSNAGLADLANKVKKLRGKRVQGGILVSGKHAAERAYRYRGE